LRLDYVLLHRNKREAVSTLLPVKICVDRRAHYTGQLCLCSCLLGDNRDVFFPKLDQGLNLITFSRIAERYLERLGL
jgi:hypothetical protein